MIASYKVSGNIAILYLTINFILRLCIHVFLYILLNFFLLYLDF